MGLFLSRDPLGSACTRVFKQFWSKDFCLIHLIEVEVNANHHKMILSDGGRCCLMPFNGLLDSGCPISLCLCVSLCVGVCGFVSLSALEPLSSPSNYFIMQMSHHYFISEAANHRS